MKKLLIIAAIILASLILLSFTSIYIWIGHDVKENIALAKAKYPGGKAEDALIAYLIDTTNSPSDRSHIAVWTLGQIKSQKAIPILMDFYLDDPEGNTCKGRHNQVLCQYELGKALNAQKSNWWPLHPGLNE